MSIHKMPQYPTKEARRGSSTPEGDQLELNQYWKRKRSNKELGRDYEAYIGYLYEENGYEVEYNGVFMGYADQGIDLICTKNDAVVLVQCKNWSQVKSVTGEEVFKFSESVSNYKNENQDKQVKGIFITSTKFSRLAEKVAEESDIQLKGGKKLDTDYPCIKCNVSTLTGEKIFHLPTDKYYYRTRVERRKGEFYCKTVEEARQRRFRRTKK